jgi:daunorubicin resistance ABC transporter membrane protein
MSINTVSTTSTEVIHVQAPGRGIRHELRAVKIVWYRELLRFWRDRTRVWAVLSQPVLWLLVMGTGLSNLVRQGGSDGDIDLRTFIYPGVCAMSIMFTSVNSAASIVWDREFGFLREMLVAPVSRVSIVTGKCLGGAAVATGQGSIVMFLAGFAGVPYHPLLLLTLLGEMFLGALALTGFAVMMAARFKSLNGFLALNQTVIIPMMFLSGAFFPLTGLPGWLSVLTRLDPLTYVVDPMRQAVFAHVNVSPQLAAAYNPGVTWGGWVVPVWLELIMVGLMAVSLLRVAVYRFRQSD